MELRSKIVLLALAGASLAGCDDGRPTRVPISGQVLIDGKPLTLGFIRFIAEKQRPASSEIGPDGRFTLGTYGKDDGVVLGTHKVTISACEVLGPRRQRWLAPKRYARPNSTDQEVKIDGPTDDLVIELTWDGGKPFVERSGDAGE